MPDTPHTTRRGRADLSGDRPQKDRLVRSFRFSALTQCSAHPDSVIARNTTAGGRYSAAVNRTPPPATVWSIHSTVCKPRHLRSVHKDWVASPALPHHLPNSSTESGSIRTIIAVNACTGY